MKIKNLVTALLASALVVGAMTVSAMAAGDMNDDVANAVANIGDEYYSTVALAIDDAVSSTDETVKITVLKDVETIPEPKRAGLIFEAAEGVKVTSYVETPRNYPVEGEVKYVGFDFTTYDSANGLYATRHGQEDLAGFEAVFEDCAFGGQRSIGIWHWAVKHPMEKITLIDCTISDTEGKQHFHFGAVNEVVFEDCNFSNYNGTDYIIHLPDSAGSLSVTGCDFGTGYINFAPNLGDFERDIIIDDCTFEGDIAVRIHENVTNNETPIGTVQLTNNIVAEDTEIIYFKDENVNAAEYMEDNTATIIVAGNETTSGEAVTEISEGYTPAPTIAIVDGIYYTAIGEAITAADALEAEDAVINLLAGTFEKVAITLPSNISDVTFKGADNHGTILKNSSIGHSGGMNAIKTNITFDGIVFENSNINLTAIYENTKIENMTVTNCKFLNIEGKAAVSINTNSLPNLVGFTFTNNVIDGVTGGSFSGLVLRAAPTGDIVITGNEISNVAWNAVQLVNLTADANVTIADNTMSSGASEGVLNIYNAKCGIILENNSINTVEGQNAISGFTPVAKLGDKQYSSLAGAIADAASGDTIDLMGNTVKLPEPNTLLITKDITIENGTLDITNGVWNGDAVIMVKGGTESDFVTLTLNKVDFVGDNYSSAFGVVYVTEYGKAVINECNFDLSNERFSGGGVLKGNGVTQSAFDVTKSTFTLENPNRVITNATVALNEVTIDAVVTDKTLVPGDTNNHALRNCVGTIENSKISVDGFETGIKNTDGDLVVSNNSSVVLTNSVVADIVLTAGNDIAVDTTSELLADTSDIADGATIEGVVVKADTVYIQYKKTDIDGTTDTLEGADTYEIILAGYNAEKINELASADITFDFNGTPYTGAAMTYTVTPAKGVTLTQLGDTDRYMFNYNGVDKYEETGAAIVIGTIEVSGYGKYDLRTDATVTTNAVYATEIRDNIVDGFEAAGELVINDNAAFNDMEGYYDDIEIVVPTRKLTINVDFPNAVENNKYDYQQMKVTVSGGDLDEALVIELGNDYTIDLSAYTDKTGCAATAVFADGAYKVTLTKLLTKDVAYNVEVSGTGYRTARYTVTMQGEDTDGKVLNFWNNVKDNALEVEEGKATSAKTVTYLAGDIVKDSVINIYDLSAVVSYFGETMSTDEYNAYAKYDLNRDGKIDSKDVAYVLVSWGK